MRDLTPALSFAIPYYRGHDYLREAIDSVLAQTRGDWELMVVDDCGPEPAEDIVNAYADPRIIYVRNEKNLGLSRNWNECVRLARAPWVTLVHGDDRLLPHYAERVLESAASAPAVAAVFTDAAIIGPDGLPTNTLADRVKKLLARGRLGKDLVGDDGLAPLLAGNYIVCPTLCLHRETVGPAPFDTRWGFVPDWAFTTRQLLEGRRLRGVPEQLLEYRRHESSQTSVLTLDSSRFIEEIDFLDETRAQARALGWRRSERSARRRVTVRGHLAVKALLDLAHGRLRAASEKMRLLVVDLGFDVRRRANHPDSQK